MWIALPSFRPHWVCPVQGCLCFPRLHCSGSRLLYMERALCRVQFQFSGPPQKRRFGCAYVLCLLRPERSISQRFGRSLPGCGVPFPSAASGPGSQRFGRPLPECSAPFPSLASGPGSHRLGRPLPGCGAPFPSLTSSPGSQRLGRTFPGCSAPFPSAAPARTTGRVSGSLQIGTGACLLGGRGWLLWG